MERFVVVVLSIIFIIRSKECTETNKRTISFDKTFNRDCGMEGNICYSEAPQQGICCKDLLCEWYDVGSGVCTKTI